MAIAVGKNDKAGYYDPLQKKVFMDAPVTDPDLWNTVTPLEFTGAHPIHEPTYGGDASHLIVLDKNWVILILDKHQTMFDRINVLTAGGLLADYNLWIGSNQGFPSDPNYNYRNDMNAEWGSQKHQAQIDIGLKLLEQTSTFSITSSDDSNYSSAQNPTNVDRVFVPVGHDHELSPQAINADDIFGEFSNGIDINKPWYYCYLEFPTSMVDGKTYTITTGTTPSDSVTFLFDRKLTVSRAIKVNQAGYLPDAGEKLAYLGGYLWEHGPLDLAHATSFEVINADTGEVALSGTPVLAAANPVFDPGVDDEEMYGEDVYRMDITALTATGTFFISVPGVGRSWPFKHQADVYGDVFFQCMRGLYHHRAGVDYTTKFTPWGIRKAFRGPFFWESQCVERTTHLADPLVSHVFNIIGYTALESSTVTAEAPGGWHDAADFDSRRGHFMNIFHLLNAYEFRKSKLTANQLHLPESASVVPDILCEARHGLEIYRLSQNGSGGITEQLETNTHPQRDGTDHITVEAKKSVFYAFSQRTRWSSCIFAAAAAQYARLVKEFDAADSALYETAATNAYNFGNTPANSLGTINIDAANDRGVGTPYTIPFTETDDHNDVYLMHAKCQMYLLTDDITYITNAPSVVTLDAQANTLGPYTWQFTRMDYSQWIYYSIIQAADAGATVLNGLRNNYVSFFTNRANGRLTYMNDAAYKTSWKKEADAGEYIKGFSGLGNTNPCNDSVELWIGYQLTGNESYRDAAILNGDSLFGCNPNSWSWVCKVGSVYPCWLQHTHSERDNIYDSVPGVQPYAITGGPIFFSFRDGQWSTKLKGSVTSLTQVGGLATCVMSEAHDLVTGDKVRAKDWDAAEYNTSGEGGSHTITVTNTTTFTFPVDSGAPASTTGGQMRYMWAKSSHRAPPFWRRWTSSIVNNVGQCEYTINETMGTTLFHAAMLLPDNYIAGDAIKFQTPRPKERVWGRWYI